MSNNPNNWLKRLLDQLERITGTDNAAAITAFGETSVAENRTQAGWGPFRNLKPQNVLQEVNLTGVVDVVDNKGRVQTGANSAGAAVLRSRAYFSYNPGIGAVCRFTAVFGTPSENSEQWIGPFSYNSTTFQPENGWAVGYKGLVFGFARFSQGVEQEFIPQTAWEIDKFENLNPQVGNVYQLQLQWLGYGAQTLSIEDNTTGGTFQNAHQINYANQSTDTSVEFPSTPFTMLVRNTGNTSNITLQSPSSYIASQGEPFPTALSTLQGYKFPLTNFSGGVETYAFSIRNPVDYLGLQNYAYVSPTVLTLLGDDPTPITFDIYLNMDLTGPVFTDIDTTNTPAQFDESATAFSGGTFLATFSTARDTQIVFDADDLEIRIWPGDTLTMLITSETNGSAGAGLTFRSRI